LEEIESFFGDKVIWTWIWPSWSPDLTPMDVFMCDLLFKHNRRTADDMRTDNTNETVRILPAILAAIFAKMEGHVSLSTGKETNFSIFLSNPFIATSTKVCVRQVSFSSVHYCVIYIY
jgi:hypothetical protein